MNQNQQPQPNTPTGYVKDRKMTRLEFLYAVYNEQLEQLVRIQAELALFERFVIKEPNNQENITRRQNLKKGYEIKKDLINILSKNIEEEESQMLKETQKEPVNIGKTKNNE